MSKRMLIAIVIIVIIVTAGMVMTVKRSVKTGSAARDADVSTPLPKPPAKPP